MSDSVSEEQEYSDYAYSEQGDAEGTIDMDDSMDIEYDSYQEQNEDNEVSLGVQYQILSIDEVKQDIDNEVRSAQSVLGMSYEEAFKLLQYYSWRSRIIEDYFSDMDKMKQNAGIVTEQDIEEFQQTKEYQELQESFQKNNDQGLCQICFTEVDRKDLRSSVCQKHYYCTDCWTNHLRVSMEGGRAIVDLRCPEPKCRAYVPESIFQELLDKSSFQKYQRFSVDTYIQAKSKLNWCTGPNCDYLVKSNQERSFEKPLDVCCTYCNTRFCFVCLQDAHEPVTCSLVKKWLMKNQAESENTTYILAICKPCPKCSSNIEKNLGCMHMSCSQCKHQFCWLCLQDWSKHGQQTGGDNYHYQCNTYQDNVRKGQLSQADEIREKAKRNLDRYLHYFERFDFHDKAKKTALLDKKRTQDRLEELSFQTNTPLVQLKCIIEAWQQVIDCRRILSWTYAYGYYNVQLTPSAQEQQIKEFFEFTQGQMEYNLDRLHHLLENELKQLLDKIDKVHVSASDAGKSKQVNQQKVSKLTEIDLQNFTTLRLNLVNQTGLIKQYFQKLVDCLQGGISNLVTIAQTSDLDYDLLGELTPVENLIDLTKNSPKRQSRSNTRARKKLILKQVFRTGSSQGQSSGM